MSQSSLSTSAQIDGSQSNHSHLADSGISLIANRSSIIGADVVGGNDTSHIFTVDKNSSDIRNSSSPDEWLQLPKMDNFVDVFALCCSTAVIVGSLVPYIPQYLKIKRSLNSDGFSTYG